MYSESFPKPARLGNDSECVTMIQLVWKRIIKGLQKIQTNIPNYASWSKHTYPGLGSDCFGCNCEKYARIPDHEGIPKPYKYISFINKHLLRARELVKFGTQRCPT